jgi:hypothetical protein
MKFSEATFGNYYSVTWKNMDDYKSIIIKLQRDSNFKNHYITADHKSYCFSDCCNGNVDKDEYFTLTPATLEEIAWLDACIVAGKFVPKPEYLPPKINDNYDVF